MKDLLKKVSSKFFTHNTFRMASSLAFYTSIALAPLLILFVSFSSALPFDLKKGFIEEISHLVGPQGADIVRIILANAEERQDLSAFASLMSTGIMLIASSFVFGELRSSLNEIFHANNQPIAPSRTILQEIGCYLRDNTLHVGIVLSFFVVLMTSLVVSSMISSALLFPVGAFTFVFNLGVSLVSYAAIFTLLFHYLPAKKVSWSLALRGGSITAFLFLIGKELIGIYLGNSTLSSVYGAAGSLVVFSSWIYYSSMIIFFGAELIAVLRQRQIIEKAHA